jgi:hypothetical protein
MEFGLIPAQLTLLAFSRDAHYDGANLINRELLKRLPKAITLHHNVRFATTPLCLSKGCPDFFHLIGALGRPLLSCCFGSGNPGTSMA